MKNKCLYALFVLCGILTFAAMIRNYQSLHNINPTVSVVLDEALPQQQFKDILEKMQQGDQYADWRVTACNKEELTIKNPEIDHIAKVTGICYLGMASDLLPFRMKSGNGMIDGDTAGCLIDRETAASLFGSVDCLGLSVQIHEVTYLVRGIIDSSSAICLYQSKDDKAMYTRLEISNKDVPESDEAVQFLYRYGLSGTILEKTYLIRVISNILLVPFLIFVLLLVKGNYHQKKHCIIVAVAAVLFVIAVRWFGYLPLRLIPSKWSNFNFYGEQKQELRGILHQFIYGAPWICDISVKISLVKLLIQTILATMFSVIGALFLRKYQKL